MSTRPRFGRSFLIVVALSLLVQVFVVPASMAVVPGSISGTVTAAGSGDPLSGVWVESFDTVTGDGVGELVLTDGAGDYTITDLPPGTYRVVFFDNTTYIPEYWQSNPAVNAYSVLDAEPVAVVGGVTTTGTDVVLEVGGTISGTVTAVAGGLPLEGIFVDAEGGAGVWLGFAQADANGDYTVCCLGTGSWDLTFTDFVNQPPYADARVLDVAVVAPGAVTGIDVAMDHDTDGDGFGDTVDNFPTVYSECRSRQATIMGTAAGEVINGTAGVDVIMGLGGADTIDGLAGDDLICAGDGADVVHGGDGKDKIYGENGTDTIYGDEMSDRIYGGNGNDTLRGNGGTRDRLYGGDGVDDLNGGTGTDDRCTLGETYANCESITF